MNDAWLWRVTWRPTIWGGWKTGQTHPASYKQKKKHVRVNTKHASESTTRKKVCGQAHTLWLFEWQKKCTHVSVSCTGCENVTLNHRKYALKKQFALHSVGASICVTIMRCSRLLSLALFLHVGRCLEFQGKSAGLQPTCDHQLFMGLFNWTLRSYLPCGIYTQQCYFRTSTWLTKL